MKTPTRKPVILLYGHGQEVLNFQNQEQFDTIDWSKAQVGQPIFNKFGLNLGYFLKETEAQVLLTSNKQNP
jgi:hypothetical protein